MQTEWHTGLVLVVDLAAPEVLAPRWSAYAAVMAARGARWAQAAWARDGLWHYDDGGGNWADLVLVGQGRAVLVGHDHEYSDTYFRDAAEYFGEPETDLLDGVPSWWAGAVSDHLGRSASDGLWIGFIYGFDGSQWWRARYDTADGFTALHLPFVATTDTVDAVCGVVGTATGDAASTAAVQDPLYRWQVERLIERCPAADREVVASVLSPMGDNVDVDAALTAAHAFIQQQR
jgi:hypothetical protein